MADSPRLRLWLLRHAQPIGVEGLCYGATDVSVAARDTHVAAQAFFQAFVQARRQDWGVAAAPMHDVNETMSLPTVWVSERTRAQDLAQAVCALLADSHVPAQVDARLNEFDFGQWEGVPWAHIPKSALDVWTADFAHHRFGGQDSTAALVLRVQSALQSLRTLQPCTAGSTDPTRHVVWVTHAGVIRAVEWLRRGQPVEALRAQDWPVQAPAFGQWQVVDFP